MTYLDPLNELTEADIDINKFESSNRSLSYLFSCLWDPEAPLTGITEVQKANKDELAAEKFRKAGENYMEKGDYHKALESINKSIIFSPSPETADDRTGCRQLPEKQEIGWKIREGLSLGYAARSEVLYELEDFDACLKDIDRSTKAGYPALLKPRLIERRIKCYVALGEVTKARGTFERYVVEVSDLEGGEEVQLIKKSLEGLGSLLSGPDGGKVAANNKDSEEFRRQRQLCIVPHPDIPRVVEQNPKVPSLSSAATLIYSEQKGRHLIAKRDILPGEVVRREKSFLVSLEPSHLLTHCTYCLTRTFTPIPCPDCSYVVFCSEDCLAKAETLFHRMECPILPTLMKNGGKFSCNALRCVLQMTLEGLRSKIPIYDKEKEEKNPVELGFDEESIYASDDFRQIYHLKTNVESRTFSDIVGMGKRAVLLVKLLKKSGYFGDDSDGRLGDEILVGKTIMTLLMNFPCNGVPIFEYGTESDCCLEIGQGVFSVFGLTDHSCNPTIDRTYYGSTLISRAIQLIPAGTEITSSYGPAYALHNLGERQSKLLQNYFFSCNCEACQNDWPMRDYLEDKTFLRCPKCKAKIDSDDKTCTICDVEVLYDGKSKEQLEVDLRQIEKNVSELWLKRTNKSGMNQLGSADEELLIRALLFLHSYSVLPNKCYVNSQTLLKQYYEERGSHYCY